MMRLRPIWVPSQCVDRRHFRCRRPETIVPLVTAIQHYSLVDSGRRAQSGEGGREPKMTNIPTELLRTLVTVVELRSFTRAAHALGVTQPAVSAQIKRLQSMLGGELL